MDVWGVHGMGGFIGTVLLGVLADPSECADGDAAPSWCARTHPLLQPNVDKTTTLILDVCLTNVPATSQVSTVIPVEQDT